jgi:hypothetical protein
MIRRLIRGSLGQGFVPWPYLLASR